MQEVIFRLFQVIYLELGRLSLILMVMAIYGLELLATVILDGKKLSLNNTNKAGKYPPFPIPFFH